MTGPGQMPTSYAEFGPLARHLRYVERTSRKLARSTFYGMSRWQGRLEHRQGFLARIVDIGAELLAITAVCVRAQEDSAEFGLKPYELADTFCHQARARAEALFDRLWENTDAEDVRLARRVLDGRYTFMEEGIVDPSLEGPWIASQRTGPATFDDVHRRIG